MSRKQIAKPVFVNFRFSEREVVEMFLLMENLFNILDNRHMITLNKFDNDTLNSLIFPIEQAFNQRINESNGIAVMTVLSKDLTAFKRILKHIQARSEYYTGEPNQKIKTLDEILTR